MPWQSLSTLKSSSSEQTSEGLQTRSFSYSVSQTYMPIHTKNLLTLIRRKAVGSVACWKRHKSANYHAATECLNETMDMRMKTTLFERQSKWLAGKLRRSFDKIVANVGMQYFHFPTSSERAENRLQHSRDKRKRTKTASDNPSRYVTIWLNGDCLSRCKPIWQQSLRSSPSKGKPCTWRRETVLLLIRLTKDV